MTQTTDEAKPQIDRRVINGAINVLAQHYDLAPHQVRSRLDSSRRVGTREAARILGVHENSVRNWGDMGFLPYAQASPTSHRRYRVSDLEALRIEREQKR